MLHNAPHTQRGFSLLEYGAVLVLTAILAISIWALWGRSTQDADVIQWVADTLQLTQNIRLHYGDDFDYSDMPTSIASLTHVLPDNMKNQRAVTTGTLTIVRGGAGFIPNYASNESFRIIQNAFTTDACTAYTRQIALSPVVQRVYVNGVLVKEYNETQARGNYATRCNRRNNTIEIRSA